MAMTEQAISEVPEWTFGDRLRKAREHRKMEQSEMADALGVSRAVVSKWERGSQPRNLFEVVQRWSEVTGVPAQWLLGVSASG